MNFLSTVQNAIKKNHRLDYLQKCFRFSGDPSFRDLVLGLHRNPLLVEYESFGDKNPDKTLYVFRIASPTDGFFAVYKNLLEALYFADRMHFTPVVDFTENFLYKQKGGIDSISNPYEYYFEQPAGIKLEETKNSFLVVTHQYKYQTLIEPQRSNSWYSATEDYIKLLAETSKKYMKLNANVKDLIQTQRDLLLQNKRTLGVHARGTDFRIAFNGHPATVSTDEYVQAAAKAMKEKEFDQLFLATDDEAVLERFQKEFPQKLVYYPDVSRARGKVSVAFLDAPRENHQYLLGLEVLRDMHTLAECHGLIGGLSTVSLISRVTKIANGGNYEYTSILDHGINHNNREFYPVGAKLIKERGEKHGN